MASILNADTSNGLKITSDTSGEIKLQSAGTDIVSVTANGMAVDTNTLYVDATNNRVGIGTSSPTISSGNGVHINGATAGPSVLHMTTGNQGTTSSDGLDIKFGAGDVSLWNYETGIMNFATSNTERMRIDSGGFTYINCTSSVASAPSYSNIVFNGVAYFGASIKTSYGSAGSTFMTFINSAGTMQGSIYANSTSTTQFLTSSDYRLKENIVPMTGALDKIALLNPVNWTWKADGSNGQGFIAHELQEVIPDCVSGKKDAVDKNDNPVYQGIDTSFLVATLVKAIQEQQEQIKALETRIQALENA